MRRMSLYEAPSLTIYFLFLMQKRSNADLAVFWNQTARGVTKWIFIINFRPPRIQFAPIVFVRRLVFFFSTRSYILNNFSPGLIEITTLAGQACAVGFV